MSNIQNHNTDCFFFTNVQEMAENIYKAPKALDFLEWLCYNKSG